MGYDWQADAIGSWLFYLRMRALAIGSRRFETVTEMYFVESRGGIP